MDTDTKLYDILGVTKRSSDGEIKKAYHRLAKEYHPDKNPEHGDKFKEISYAYDVLSNPEKRDTYDRYGLQGLKEGGGGPGGSSDIFEHLFGGGMGGMGGMFGGMGGMFSGMGGRRGRRKGEDTLHPLGVTLEDLYNGKTAKLQLNKTVICTKCNGRGSKSGATNRCHTCNGRGIKVSLRQLGPGMVQQMQSVCPDCRGEGETIVEKDRCKECKGSKVTKQNKILDVHVERGMKHGQKIPFSGEGDQQPDIEPGDVVIVLQQKEHELFTRDRRDLICTRNVNLTEALCGFQFVISHLDGRDMLIKCPPGQVIQPGALRVVMNEGMPKHHNPYEKGNLIIKFDVQFPESHFADEKQIKMLEKILPPRPKAAPLPTGDDVEEVCLMDFAATRGDDTNDESGDEDDGHPGHHGPGVQCAHQ